MLMLINIVNCRVTDIQTTLHQHCVEREPLLSTSVGVCLSLFLRCRPPCELAVPLLLTVGSRQKRFSLTSRSGLTIERMTLRHTVLSHKVSALRNSRSVH